MATLQWKGETIRATDGHPFWVVRGEGLADRRLPVRIAAYEAGGRQEGRWVLACDLRAGDELLLRCGEVAGLESVRLDEVVETVYNFKVAELHNYAVASYGVLVHNTNEEILKGLDKLRRLLRKADKLRQQLKRPPDWSTEAEIEWLDTLRKLQEVLRKIRNFCNS